ncbi:MAG: ornithine cyclodeaminase family protein [Chloroflexia bacterium]
MGVGKLLYLSRADVEAVGLDMATIIQRLEEAFREKGEGRVEVPPKPGIHPVRDAFIHAMPAYIPAMKAAGIKWVSGYPENWRRNLPYINALIILNDPETGLPIAVMDGSWITAKRTAAATALAAKYLARADCRTLGILGCGVQGRAHVEALRALFSIERVYAYDIRPEVQAAYVEEMRRQHGIDVIEVSSPRHAVEASDIVVTAGPILKEPDPTIQPGWLSEGAFACPVDFDSYWTPEALAQVDRYATDDREQYAYYRERGYFQRAPTPYADLGDLVAGKQPGRQSPRERTMAMNLGLALEDMATAVEVYRRAVERKIGVYLPL